MPFTPFHMGPALLLKAAAQSRFSLLIFGFSQVLIDLEPLIRILRGDEILHGFTHTITGAAIVAVMAAVLGRPPANWLLDVMRQDAGDAFARAILAGTITMPVALVSAAIGTASHLILDGIMHGDIAPLAPFSTTNPLLGVVGLGPLHLFCLVTAAIGLAAMMALAALKLYRDSRRSGEP